MAWLGRAARRCGRTAAQLRRFARSRRSSSQTDRRHELGDLAQVVDEAGVLARPLSLASGRRSETGAWQGSREASPGEFLVELVLALTFERDEEIVGQGPVEVLADPDLALQRSEPPHQLALTCRHQARDRSAVKMLTISAPALT